MTSSATATVEPTVCCAQCGYDLRGLDPSRCACPECGLAINASLTDAFIGPEGARRQQAQVSACLRTLMMAMAAPPLLIAAGFEVRGDLSSLLHISAFLIHEICWFAGAWALGFHWRTLGMPGLGHLLRRLASWKLVAGVSLPFVMVGAMPFVAVPLVANGLLWLSSVAVMIAFFGRWQSALVSAPPADAATAPVTAPALPRLGGLHRAGVSLAALAAAAGAAFLAVVILQFPILRGIHREVPEEALRPWLVAAAGLLLVAAVPLIKPGNRPPGEPCARPLLALVFAGLLLAGMMLGNGRGVSEAVITVLPFVPPLLLKTVSDVRARDGQSVMPILGWRSLAVGISIFTVVALSVSFKAGSTLSFVRLYSAIGTPIWPARLGLAMFAAIQGTVAALLLWHAWAIWREPPAEAVGSSATQVSSRD